MREMVMPEENCSAAVKVRSWTDLFNKPSQYYLFNPLGEEQSRSAVKIQSTSLLICLFFFPINSYAIIPSTSMQWPQAKPASGLKWETCLCLTGALQLEEIVGPPAEWNTHTYSITLIPIPQKTLQGNVGCIHSIKFIFYFKLSNCHLCSRGCRLTMIPQLWRCMEYHGFSTSTDSPICNLICIFNAILTTYNTPQLILFLSRACGWVLGYNQYQTKNIW